MIVPLSLSFSGDFDSCRQMLYKFNGENWFSSFARIPAALFAADVRVRNVIHIGRRKGKKSNYTTRLHRWFEEFRPYLMDSVQYAEFKPAQWQNLVPRTSTNSLTRSFESLNRQGHTISTTFSQYEKGFPLYFKKSAYNWLCFCRNLPPCYNASGKSIEHTEFGVVHFGDAATQRLALLFLNGKIEFAYWAIMGDDFHVAKWMFADFPANFASLPSNTTKRLMILADQLETMMVKNVSFKLNAGKRVGNYNLAKCRSLTDQSDRIFAEHLGLIDVWPDIERLYNQIVLTTFDQTDE